MENLITRLDRIFEGLLGCRLSYIPVEEISRSEWLDGDLEGYLHGSDASPLCIRDVSAARLGFPVRRSGMFAGLAVLTDWRGADETRLNEMAEFVTAMIEKELVSGERAELLRATEEQIERQRGHKNVIQLRFNRAQVTQFPGMPMETVTVEAVPALLVQHKPGFPLQRVALEVHNRANRWVFVSSKDLPADVFDTRESIVALGAATVFIEDLALLPLETQSRIADYLVEAPSAETPTIFAAVTETPEELEATGRLLPALREKLAFTRLIWNPQDDDSTVVRASVRLIMDGPTAGAAKDLSRTRFVPFHKGYLDQDNPSVH